MMSFPGASHFLNALGWALLNSLWQSAIFYVVYRLLTGVFKMSAAIRHRLALYLLLPATAWFFAGLLQGDGFAGSGRALIANSLLYRVYLKSSAAVNSIASYLSIVYIACIILLLLKFLLLLRQNRLLRGEEPRKMPVKWRLYIRDVAERLGIRKEVTALLSGRVDTPQVLGFFKPLILVPVAFLNHLTPLQAEAVLLHELVHIKRNDYLVNLFLATAEVIFFFNPFTRQLIAAVRREREYSCDDMVMQFRYPAKHYAAALLSLEKHRGKATGFGIAAGGGGGMQLLHRVQRIVGVESREKSSLRTGILLWSAFLLTGITFIRPVAEPAPAAGYRPPVMALLTVRDTRNNDFIASAAVPAKEAIRLPFRDRRGSSGDTRDAAGETCRDPLLLMIRPASSQPGAMAELRTQTALQPAMRDFSLPEEAAAEIPARADFSAALPYVPGNSFTYYFVPDTSQPVAKNLTYEECMAREALEKTRAALEQIDWKKIELQLANKSAASGLRKEIAKELAKLNWQKINETSRRQLLQEQSGRMEKLAQQQQQVQQYREAAVYFEALQKKLQDNQQYLMDLQLQQEQFQKILSDRNKQIPDSLRKKRVIII